MVECEMFRPRKGTSISWHETPNDWAKNVRGNGPRNFDLASDRLKLFQLRCLLTRAQLNDNALYAPALVEQ
ncbi:MAG: hypothetical protein DMF61_13900 [Blastocatellia bacterium AA13]|nr:MAG: hypothetical protein DMF61_13900 [Blastocatellia bacterium AA13]